MGNYLIGARKLIGTLGAVGGIVLVQMYGVPQAQVDAMVNLLVELLSNLVAIGSIAALVWGYVKTQGKIDEAAQVASPPVPKASGPDLPRI